MLLNGCGQQPALWCYSCVEVSLTSQGSPRALKDIFGLARKPEQTEANQSGGPEDKSSYWLVFLSPPSSL